MKKQNLSQENAYIAGKLFGYHAVKATINIVSEIEKLGDKIANDDFTLQKPFSYHVDAKQLTPNGYGCWLYLDEENAENYAEPEVANVIREQMTKAVAALKEALETMGLVVTNSYNSLSKDLTNGVGFVAFSFPFGLDETDVIAKEMIAKLWLRSYGEIVVQNKSDQLFIQWIVTKKGYDQYLNTDLDTYHTWLKRNKFEEVSSKLPGLQSNERGQVIYLSVVQLAL